MQIRSITYARRKNEESWEATCILQRDDPPADAALAVRSLIDHQFALASRVEKLQEEESDLEYKLSRLNSQIKTAAERWERIENFFKKIGLNELDVSDLPF